MLLYRFFHHLFPPPAEILQIQQPRLGEESKAQIEADISRLFWVCDGLHVEPFLTTSLYEVYDGSHYLPLSATR